MAVREARLSPSCTRPSPCPAPQPGALPGLRYPLPALPALRPPAPSQIVSPFSPSRRPAFSLPALPRLGFSSILIPVSLSCASQLSVFPSASAAAQFPLTCSFHSVHPTPPHPGVPRTLPSPSHQPSWVSYSQRGLRVPPWVPHPDSSPVFIPSLFPSNPRTAKRSRFGRQVRGGPGRTGRG